MKQETVRALELLYGSAEAPVCAVDQRLSVLWQPDARALPLLGLLGAELGGAESTGEFVFPPEDTVILRQAQPPCACKVQRLSEDGTPYYLLRFLPLGEQRSMDAAELRALLSAQTESGRQTVAGILHAARRMEGMLSRCGETVDPAVRRMLYEGCYAQMNRAARLSELLWYEMRGQSPEASPFGTVNFSAVLLAFAEELGDLSENLLTLEETQIAPAMFAAVEPRRLRFALLLLLLSAQEKLHAASELTLSAAPSDGEITVTGTLRRAEMQPKSAEGYPFRQRIVPEGTLLSDTVLLRHFCDTFHAVCEEEAAGDGFCFRLTLPAAKYDAESAILRSPAAHYSGSRSTLTHILLSDAFSAAAYQ